MPKIKLYCNTGFAGAKHTDVVEVDDAEWEAKTEPEREAYLESVAQDFMSNHIEFGAYVMEGDDDD